MVTSESKSIPPRVGVLDRILSFFILAFLFVMLDRIAAHFEFLGLHGSFWSSVRVGAIWAILMILFVPGSSRVARRFGQTFSWR
jgi:hypothetical protein